MEIFVIFVFTLWLTKIIQIIARSKVRYEPGFGVKSTHMHTSYSNLNNFFYLKFTKSKAFLKSKAMICSFSASSSPSVKFAFSFYFYLILQSGRFPNLEIDSGKIQTPHWSIHIWFMEFIRNSNSNVSIICKQKNKYYRTCSIKNWGNYIPGVGFLINTFSFFFS